MAGKEERKEGHLMCPVFCTVKVPTELLDRLLSQSEASQDFRVMDIETGDDLSSARFPSRVPAAPPRTPFLNWSVEDIYAYWKRKLCAPGDGSNLIYSAFTFVVIDEQSVQEFATEGRGNSATVVLGSDAPDFEEGVDDPLVLKTARVELGGAAMDVVGLEMLTTSPSELGSAVGLSIMPPPALAGSPNAMRKAKINAIEGIPKGWAMGSTA